MEPVMPKKKHQVPVSERAAIQRINRKLAPEGCKLLKTRGMQAFLNLGTYHVIDVHRNHVVDSHIDLEAFGRKWGAIAGWETVVEE